MSDQPATRTIDLEIEIDAPREAAWRALTTPEELARWFPAISGGSGEVNQKLLLSWGPDFEWWTRVVAAEPEQHVRWMDDPIADANPQSTETPPPVLALDWHIDTRGGKTVVRLVHSGFGMSPDWDSQYDGLRNGWQYFLFNLRHYLERHRGTPRAMVSERRRSPVSRAELWQRLLGATGFAMTTDATLPTPGETLNASLGGRATSVAVEHASPTHLWLRFPQLDDALMFVEAEGRGESFYCGLWLSTYGLPDPQVADLRVELKSLADRVFAPAS